MHWTMPALQLLRREHGRMAPTEYQHLIHWAEIFARRDAAQGANVGNAVTMRHFFQARSLVLPLSGTVTAEE